MIFLAVLALATDEPPLSVASAKTAGVAKACFQEITASERKATSICFNDTVCLLLVANAKQVFFAADENLFADQCQRRIDWFTDVIGRDFRVVH